MTVSKIEASKPLFIPLTSQWYEQFVTGKKTFEIRPYGARWNEKTCYAGRRVTLSRGYGKRHRLAGSVTKFKKLDSFDQLPEPYRSQYIEVYGLRPGPVAMIGIGFLHVQQP